MENKMSETIKLVMVKRDMNGKDIADALGCSTQAVYANFKKNAWNETQLRKIAEKLNCELEIGFKLKDTDERF
ncbi:Cro/C1-type HTH DNA-binding domain-containing protein [Butyrivibrio fibrisolvens DSM 3071]|uniref:Cro/C1-type HTH DNA-binding domain-containing protein n=1 Tax=Butyrivibrio fibrisolvens DSM 3071 TaxID=1121131 RepID=A0A1M6FGG1_BUTFI|nr:helix-turn-helix domain-containing protein [Butyrivibrio fibrisolvens]SHI96713.1 Cro/C1-type HTH DNA-binding domain-containing protein [Butyrivibrio fibrisolvens DSM 3071]